MITIKFHRYFGDGSLSFSYEVPEKYLSKYPSADRETLARMKVWGKKVGDFTEKIDLPDHIISSLLRDREFINDILGTLEFDESIQSKFLKSINYPATNFYFHFINTEDGGKSKSRKVKTSTKIKKSKKVKKEKKVNVVKEKKQTFKDLKRKAQSRIEFAQKMQGWKDDVQINYDNPEHYLKVVTDVFKSYKMFFEENLIARNIPFVIATEKYETPGYSRYRSSSPKMYVEYILVNNTENIPDAALIRQGWEKVTIAWNTSIKRISEWSKDYVLSTKKIGIANAPAANLKKNRMKSFCKMQESAFETIVTWALQRNDESYKSKIQDFRSMKERAASNQVEINKLSKFVNNDIIPLVTEKSWLNVTEVDLSKGSFLINISYSWAQNLQVVKINQAIDNLENLSFNITFFGRAEKVVKTAADAILLFNQVFGSEAEFKTVLSVLANTKAI